MGARIGKEGDEARGEGRCQGRRMLAGVQIDGEGHGDIYKGVRIG